MPVMMTSSGECCLAREGPLAPLFDFLIFWPGDVRGFMNWIVALQVQPPLSVRNWLQVLASQSRQSASRRLEIQIVYSAHGR
jgi:hypothetical protein